MSQPPSFSTPDQIAAAGHRIYSTKYQAEFERTRMGQFVIIDVTNEQAYASPVAQQALAEARTHNPSGIFHLIRVGAPGAFRVMSYSSHANGRRLLQRVDAALSA